MSTTTPHRKRVSRKNTFMVARIMAMPRANRNRYSTTRGVSSSDLVRGTPVTTIISSSGTNEMTRLTREEVTRLRG